MHQFRNTDLVGANGGRIRGCQEIQAGVHDRDVRPPTEPSFEQKVCPACVCHLDAVHFDTNMPRSLEHVDSLRKDSNSFGKL